MGLNATLQMAGRSLEVYSAGLSVAGQNIANSSTPGYIREDLKVNANVPYKAGQQIYGTGVFIEGIQQQINIFLETRIHAANGDLSSLNVRKDMYLDLQNALNELGENDLSTALSDFSASLTALANEPDNPSLRSSVVEQGEQLARDISALRLRVDELRERQSLNIENLVAEANELIDQIDTLNPQIARLEASGLLQSDAGALRTQRYQAMQRLSEIVPVRFQERTDGGVDVFSGSNWLVLGGSTQKLETYTVADRGISATQVRLTLTQADIPAEGGELRGIIEGREEILGSFVDDLNLFTQTLIETVNSVHASGEGVIGYESITSEAQVSDPTAALNLAGLTFTPRHGAFDVKIVNQATGAIETTRIQIDLDGLGGNDTTLNSLQAALDGVTNLNASVDSLGRLQLTTDSGYEVKFGDDSSGVLSSLGINTFFTGSDSGDIGINAAISGNPQLLATGQGGGPADNSNLLQLTEFLDEGQSSLNGNSLRGFYELTVSEVAQDAAAEESLAAGADALVQSLFSQREQFSGVSLDEEAIKVLEFQRAFQSAARLISTVDELFGVLLSI
ncbi:flagellar hook-associated protein FlgK [Calycomorphotria hydatis]|uniref:Flagellar hook-associated protein 1 n=1 Tax=Calycomorphotria hydatis TaxID=2528027 RepID=A0A517TCM6_9PLAN|nr:flagellar hook-associated protein FlgK [Calycomorphotria hydatis]QDT66129.1 Flagellar hook-associated protein 1 [Calycomorphotria hydatis]